MSTEYSSCRYHEDKQAEAICYRCKSAICKEDKREYVSSSGSTSTRKRYDYCIICYATKLGSQTKNIVFAMIFSIGIFFPIMFFIVSEGEISGEDFFIFSAIIPIMVLSFISAIFIQRKKTQKAAIEASVFKQTLSGSRYFISKDKQSPSNSFEDKPFDLVCFECGGYMEVKDKFCPNCGEDTVEELQSHFNLNN